MNQQNRECRKRFFVSKSIQGRMFLRFCAFWLGCCTFLVLGLAMDALLSMRVHSIAQLCDTLWQENFWTFVLVAAACPIMLRDLLKTTHQIAGPLVRFQGVLRQLARGKRVAKVKLRKRDMLFDFQDALNEFIEARNEELDTRDIENKEHKETKSCDFANSP